MFQFTHPGRGATYRHSAGSTLTACFNSRTPGGVRLSRLTDPSLSPAVSIHAPREGCDSKNTASRVQSRVSIHAPREGCDGIGEDTFAAIEGFQFTHPGRGATLIIGEIHQVSVVSIHAPREGCDETMPKSRSLAVSFNSRTPGGVRHVRNKVAMFIKRFNSRTPGGVRLEPRPLPAI